MIGLAGDKVTAIADEAGVEVANINSSGQIVLSGERDRVAQAQRLADEAGAKRAVLLNVAGAYHSTLMATAAARLSAVLDGVEIVRPSVPVLSNVTGSVHGDGWIGLDVGPRPPSNRWSA